MAQSLSLVTTCRNRIQHVAQTLPTNLAHNTSRHANIVLLDYGSPDGLGDYIQREFSDALNKGSLVYYSMPDRSRFHMAHAKNVAHRCGILEGSDILVNLDADNFTGEHFAGWTLQKFETAIEDSEAVFLGAKKNHRGAGYLAAVRTPRGCFGRIACTTEAFIHAGGYDEIFETWSPDDKDYGMRLMNLGYSWHAIRPEFLAAIQHGQESRDEHELRRRAIGYEDNEEDILVSRRHLGVVNMGDVGCGGVYRNFDPHPIELRPIATRIFGIGLHKTGTTSLSAAFRKLGFNSAHWVSGHWAKFIWDEMHALGRSPTLEMHYSLCDLPIPLLYKELDKAYPNSKFVLTVRPEDDWVESCRTHWKLRNSWNNDVFSNTVHKALYGTTEFDEGVFRQRYRKHNEDVRQYFRGRYKDFLELDVNTARMGLLCVFFDMPYYDAPLPHKHKSSLQEKYQ